MFDEILENASKKCGELCSVNNDDYMKDGLFYCGKCHTPKQTRIYSKAFGGYRIVNCICKCVEDECTSIDNERFENEKNAHIKRLRFDGICSLNMHEWTFQNDNGSNPKLMEKAKRYVDGWNEMKKKNIGLCFFGDVGTGKTYASACIANALIDKNVRVVMTDFMRILNDMGSFDTRNKNEYVENICSSDLLIIDDLGAERQSDYALQIAQQIINERYKIAKPLILTTNISLTDLKNPSDIKYQRIYSRILEMTVPLQSIGEDKRKKTHEENMNWAKAFFCA